MEYYNSSFLMTYVTANQNPSYEAMDDLCRITKEYEDGVYSIPDRNKFFTEDDLKFYLEVLQWNLQDESTQFFYLQFDKQRYIECLIDMIRGMIKDWTSHRFCPPTNEFKSLKDTIRCW